MINVMMMNMIHMMMMMNMMMMMTCFKDVKHTDMLSFIFDIASI